MKYDVAAYIWPSYTGKEPRTRMFWPEGIGEWQSVKSAAPKYPGHGWPKEPLWGYVDEADPEVMEMEIREAVSHGVNTFIYDWYWYDDRPFLEQCLNEGFLKAKNRNEMKFYLMWANHDAVSLWDKRISDDPVAGQNVIWRGSVGRTVLEPMFKRIVSRYFTLENYYRIDGCPVFMIYDIGNFVRGLDGIEGAREAIEMMRETVKAAGFPDLHLQMTIWNENVINVSGVDSAKTGEAERAADVSMDGAADAADSTAGLTSLELTKLLSIDSISHYQFVHFADVARSYDAVLRQAEAEWARIEKEYDIPYFPHVSIGWDNNPRFHKRVDPIMTDCTPEAFKKGLFMAKEYLERHPDITPLVTINSWNEWTENSYLEPDNIYGYGYLEAVREVFGS